MTLMYRTWIPVGLNFLVLVAQSCPTLSNPTDSSLPGSAVHGIFHTGVGCQFLLPGIIQAQGLNLGLLYCRQTVYHLSYQVPQVFHL